MFSFILNNNYIKSTAINYTIKIKKNFLYINFLIISISYTVIFLCFGYLGTIPALSEFTNIDKFFQNNIIMFLKIRPIYTLFLLFISTYLQFLIFVYYQNKEKIILISIFLLSFLIFLTAKRFFIAFPFVAMIISFFFLRKYFYLLFPVIVFILLIFYFKTPGRSFLEMLSANFFVTIREFARLLSHFDDNFIHGKSYLAGVLSFVPTSINELKSDYFFTRYITLLQNYDPELSGGMRSGFISEAYINFGYIGIIFVIIIIAFTSVIIDASIKKRSFFFFKDPGTFSLYLFIIYMGIAFFEVGSASFLFSYIKILSLIFLFKFFLKKNISN